MAAVSVVVGGTTSSGAVFVAKVDDGPVRVAVADNDAMSDPVFFGPESVDGDGVAKVTAAGLDPNTRYWYQVEDDSVLDTSVTGTFLTHPPVGSHASFTIGVASCAGNQGGGVGDVLVPGRISNHPVFETIRGKALAEDWLAFGHLGDLHYYDPGSGVHVADASVGTYRRAFDDVLLQPRQAALYRDLAWWHVWDDHDYGPNNSDGTFAFKDNAAQVYRERVPHYPLTDPGGIWQAWQIGRVQFIMSDTRHYRSPNSDPDDASKSMLGDDQKQWLAGLLESSTAEVLVWLMPSQWMGTGSDTWGNFTTERDELVGLLDQHGWLRRMVMVYGDRHALGLTGGATNHWGGFPVLNAASLDSSFGSAVEGRFDVGPETPGDNQYGTVTVNDLGFAITVTLTGWQGSTEWATYTLGITVGTPPTPADLVDALPGSHDATFEARVLTTFQTGDDPDGIEIPILGGKVDYDATAKVFADLSLSTEGHDGRRSLFPRRATDLLAPYGHEVFVRRGVDLGSGTVWVPLGYFRIDDADQDGTTRHPVALSAQDRMSGIIDGRLPVPVELAAGRTIESVASELVHDIYPAAVILFDDDSGQATLGRSIIVEEKRYEALKDIADAIGKVVYWDGEGALRFESPPDPDDIAWDLRAGQAGVLVDARRGVTREGMYNGIVARGEGGDTDDPVQGIAVDNGAHSPTRWGGPFGKVPRFYASPVLTTDAQAAQAARSLLRRYIGMPYNVRFGSVPNPALRPRQAVRIRFDDGTREVHLVEKLTVPLTDDAAMTGTTKEQTLVTIGSAL